MKLEVFVMRILCSFISAAALCLLASAGRAQTPKETTMNITSPAFEEGGKIPSKFTCDGENINPALKIEGVPPAAKSLALIVDDPDAPMGTWNHWLVWNLKPDLKEIAEHSAPADAVQGANDFKKNNYGGPCPPSGTHRYFFRLYALDFVPNLPASTNRKALDKALHGHVIAEAALMGKYARGGK
jgi:Raf kinase inhibitor-like YbhB/YbcL family protein